MLFFYCHKGNNLKSETCKYFQKSKIKSLFSHNIPNKYTCFCIKMKSIYKKLETDRDKKRKVCQK